MNNKRIKEILQKTVICSLAVVLLFQVLSGCRNLNPQLEYSGLNVINYLEKIPKNICYKSSEPKFVMYCDDSGLVGKTDTIDGTKEFSVTTDYSNTLYADFGNKFETPGERSLQVTCNYLEEDLIIFKIVDADIGDYYSSDVKKLCLYRCPLTEEDRVTSQNTSVDTSSQSASSDTPS